MSDPFAERVERLKQELALALTWDRPSILLAVYASEFVRADAEALLEAWVRNQGLSVAQVSITSPDDAMADVPRALHAWPNREETVFFVAGLAQGAPTTWKALNVRREYLVEDKVRAVFWLTEREAADLPRRAPDFWVFRHWVVEFLEIPRTQDAAERAGELAWRGFEEELPAEERRARIALRQRLLAELPETRETAAARADLHYTLGGLYTRDSKHGEALDHFRATRDLAERLENAQRQVWSLSGLGIAYRHLGEVEKAIDHYQQALAIARKIGDRRGEGNALGSLGLAYSDLGQTEKAIDHYEQALAISREIGDRRGEGNVLGNLGIAYRHLGEVEKAIDHHQQALAIAREIGDRRGEGARLGNLGLAYSALGQTERAIDHYQQALAVAREIGDRRGEGNALGNLGNAYSALGQTERAIDHYQQSLAISREIGDRRNEAIACWNLGLLYEESDPARAAALMSVCVSYEREIGHPDAEADAERVARIRARVAGD